MYISLFSKKKLNFSKATHFAFPIIKEYKNGNVFQVILSDDTGNVYYPDGQLAVLISKSDDHKIFMAFNNDYDNPVQLASFDSKGNGFVNYLDGKIR